MQHFNRQSHITGLKNSNVVVCGVFDMSLKNASLIMDSSLRLSVWSSLRQREAGSDAVGPAVPHLLTMIM